MKRRTITIPDELDARLADECRRRRVPVSQVVREAVEEKLDHRGGAPADEADDSEPFVPDGMTPEEYADVKRRFPFVGVVHGSGEPPFARDLDEYLEKHWADDLRNNHGR